MSLNNDLIYIDNDKAIPSAYSLTILEFKDLTLEELSLFILW